MIQSKTLARLLVAAGATLVALALAGPAQAQEPAEGFEQFAGCPTAAESESSILCIRSEVTGGHLQVGNKDVPIKQPLVISGGVNAEFAEFMANENGGLSKVKQEVPGGIIGLTGLDWLVNFLGLEGLKLYAVSELAAPPRNFTFSSVTIPLKVKLENPALGGNCYIGEDEPGEAIVLNLITGTTEPPPPNEPITGQEPTFGFENNIVKVSDGIYVDNSFAAPETDGCELVIFGIPIGIDGLVSSVSGLPSPAGTNEVVQEFDLEFAERTFVYPEE